MVERELYSPAGPPRENTDQGIGVAPGGGDQGSKRFLGEARD